MYIHHVQHLLAMYTIVIVLQYSTRLQMMCHGELELRRDSFRIKLINRTKSDSPSTGEEKPDQVKKFPLKFLLCPDFPSLKEGEECIKPTDQCSKNEDRQNLVDANQELLAANETNEV